MCLYYSSIPVLCRVAFEGQIEYLMPERDRMLTTSFLQVRSYKNRMSVCKYTSTVFSQFMITLSFVFVISTDFHLFVDMTRYTSRMATYPMKA